MGNKPFRYIVIKGSDSSRDTLRALFLTRFGIKIPPLEVADFPADKYDSGEIQFIRIGRN